MQSQGEDQDEMEPMMAVRYVTDEHGKRVGVVLDIEEYERLLEIEEDMEDLAALESARKVKRSIQQGGDELISWSDAMEEIRAGKVPPG